MRVDIVIFDGFDELDASGPYEVLRHVARVTGDIDVRLITLTGAAEVMAACVSERTSGSTGHPTSCSSPAARAPSPRLNGVSSPATSASCTRAAPRSRRCAPARCWPRRRRASPPAGRPPPTTPSSPSCARAARRSSRPRVVDDGDLVTAGGVTCGLDLALWLVERELGAPTADAVAVAAEMEYARPSAVRRAEVG